MQDSSMTAALEGGEWSAARPGALYPRERSGIHFTRFAVILKLNTVEIQLRIVQVSRE